MGAGVLPVALHKGTLFLLLGQERHNNLWSDFGGGTKQGETSLKTAIREGTEELSGYLGDYNELENKLKKKYIAAYKDDRNTSYLFKQSYYLNLPSYFNKNNRFIEQYCCQNFIKADNGLFEKKRIKWYSINELQKSNTKNIIRPHYYNIVLTICNNEKLIIDKIKDFNY